MQMCLGTVQFGMKYGINNQIGRQPTWEESFAMIDAALDAGINTIDTARAYGEAELVLGEYFATNKEKSKDLKVVSKLRPNVIDWERGDIYGQVRLELEDSLKRMGLDKLDGYLLHTPEFVYNTAVVAALARFKEEGLVDHIGVSIYDMKEGFAAINTGVMDCMQMPYNVLDQRGVKSGLIAAARKAGFIIGTRSAFLQGLFMMESNSIPAHLKNAVPYIETVRSLASKYGLDTVTATMGFVVAEDNIDYLVFGVEKLSQVNEDIEKFKTLDMPSGYIEDIKAQIEAVDESIIIPSLWSNGKKAD